MKRLGCILAACLTASPASAHPWDEVVQAAYLTLAPGEVRLQMDLIAGGGVANSVLRALDGNADRSISEAEGKAYAERVLAQSTLQVDGGAATWRVEKVIVPPYGNIETAGETIEIHAVAKVSDRTGARTLNYENRYDPAACLCVANIFLSPADGWDYSVIRQQRSDDGRRYAVSYTSSRN